ncbi:MAG: hypothetical protein R3C11_16725 [Planctomycetaceae bacterium]
MGSFLSINKKAETIPWRLFQRLSAQLSDGKSIYSAAGAGSSTSTGVIVVTVYSTTFPSGRTLVLIVSTGFKILALCVAGTPSLLLEGESFEEPALGEYAFWGAMGAVILSGAVLNITLPAPPLDLPEAPVSFNVPVEFEDILPRKGAGAAIGAELSGDVELVVFGIAGGVDSVGVASSEVRAQVAPPITRANIIPPTVSRLLFAMKDIVVTP